MVKGKTFDDCDRDIVSGEQRRAIKKDKIQDELSKEQQHKHESKELANHMEDSKR